MITGYQRYLSPRKGYSCAYRVVYGGPGCSGFSKQAIAEQGFFRAIPAIRLRFNLCRVAAEETDRERRNRKLEKFCDRTPYCIDPTVCCCLWT